MCFSYRLDNDGESQLADIAQLLFAQALRDQEGGWIGSAVLNTNGSHDLGPLQVNTWWVPRIASLVGRPPDHVRHWLRMDPCFNANVARWIFLKALAQSGDS